MGSAFVAATHNLQSADYRAVDQIGTYRGCKGAVPPAATCLRLYRGTVPVPTMTAASCAAAGTISWRGNPLNPNISA